MKAIQLFLLLCYACIAFTQEQSFPDINAYILKYPSLSAVTCTDRTNIDVIMQKNGTPAFTVDEKTDIFILKDNLNNFSEWASYFNGDDLILKNEAYTLNLIDGKVQRIKMENINKVTEIDDVNYFDDSYSMVGHFPAIKKGSLLQSHNKYISTKAEQGFRFYFGGGLFVEESAISVTVPEGINMRFQLVAADTTAIIKTVSQQKNKTIYTWSYKNIKNKDFETHTPNIRFYRPHLIINIESYKNKNGEAIRIMGNLDDFYKWAYSQINQVNLNLPANAKTLVDSITSLQKTDEDKVKTLYKWVQENIRYIAIEDGKNGYIPRDAEKVFNLRYGDCKDKSALLVSMLRHIGLEASMVLVGTRNLPYTFTNFPMIGTANHMVAAWHPKNANPVILDGTTRHLGIFETPSAIQGKECLIISTAKEFQLYNIPELKPEWNKTTDRNWVTLSGNTISGNASAILQGSRKADLMHHTEGKNKEELHELIANSLGFSNKVQIQNLEIIKPTKSEDAIQYNFTLNAPGYCITNNDKVYVNLNFDKMFEQIVVKENRNTPFEFDEKIYSDVITELRIPENYTVVSTPEKASFSHPKFSFSIEYSINQQSIVSKTSIRTDFQLLKAEEIDQFRLFLQNIKKAYRNTVSLQKKSTNS